MSRVSLSEACFVLLFLGCGALKIWAQEESSQFVSPESRTAWNRFRTTAKVGDTWELLSSNAKSWVVDGDGSEVLLNTREEKAMMFDWILKITDLSHEEARSLLDDKYVRTVATALVRSYLEFYDGWELVSGGLDRGVGRIVLEGPRAGRTVLLCDAADKEWGISKESLEIVLHWLGCRSRLETVGIALLKFDAEHGEYPAELEEIGNETKAIPPIVCATSAKKLRYFYPVNGDRTNPNRILLVDSQLDPVRGALVLAYGGEVGVVDGVELELWIRQGAENLEKELEAAIQAAEAPGGSRRALRALREMERVRKEGK